MRSCACEESRADGLRFALSILYAAASETIGAVHGRWTDPPTLWDIETEESFSLEDLMRELGRLELQALGYVKHGDVPREDHRE